MSLFDLAAGLVLIVSVLVGWFRGAAREVATVAALVAAAVVALFALRFSGPVARHAIHMPWLANIAAILIVFAGLALGFGLALGLGGRDTMAGILAGYYVRQRLQAGDHVTVGNLEGTVREVGPVATIVETEEDGLLNRRSIPNNKMLNEAVR